MTKQEALGIYARAGKIVTIIEVPFEDLPLTIKTNYSEHRACFRMSYYIDKKLHKGKFVTEEEMIKIVETMIRAGWRK